MSNVTARETKRKGRTASLLKEIVSSFIKLKINLEAIVTVMRVEMTTDLRLAKVFISVFPGEKEREFLAALKRKDREFKNFMKDKIKVRILPSVTFEADKSWKLEQRIKELLNKQRVA